MVVHLPEQCCSCCWFPSLADVRVVEEFCSSACAEYSEGPLLWLLLLSGGACRASPSSLQVDWSSSSKSIINSEADSPLLFSELLEEGSDGRFDEEWREGLG